MDTVFTRRSTVFDLITELSLQSHSQAISQAYDYRPCNIIYFLIAYVVDTHLNCLDENQISTNKYFYNIVEVIQIA